MKGKGTKITIAFSILILFPALGISQTTWYVDGTNTNGPWDGSQANPFQYIQEGIDATSHGDTILAMPYTYVENIDFIGKAVTLTSELGAEVTVIDGNQAGCVVFCQNGEDENTTLDGFTITNAYILWDGAGMLNDSSSPTISNCVFRENRSENGGGGGMYNANGSSPTVTNCTFNLNHANKGGGMHNEFSSPTVTNCTFSENVGYQVGGGGMSNCSSSPTVTDCTFGENFADIGYGGGMSNWDDSSPMVTNCTFSGNCAGGWYGECGGGMCNWESDPIVTNCTFIGNSAYFGGGMYNADCNPTVTNCAFEGNSCIWNGGGMYNYYDSYPIVTYCTFSQNEADSGGGMFNAGGEPTVVYCTFVGNSAHNGSGMFNGGCSPTVSNCLFINNSAYIGNGGGMLNVDGSCPSVANSTFSGNSALDEGGGMYNYYESSPAATNCCFSGNTARLRGGGMYNCISCNPTVTNSTFTENSADNGGGIYCAFNSSATVTNTVLWKNFATRGPEISILGSSNPSTLTISYSDVKGGQSSIYVQSGSTLNWGPRMIDADPLFVHELNDDFHLTYNSPCRNTGDNTAATELYDFEGDPRIAYGTVDMGADEFYTHLYCTGNFTPGGAIEGKLVGLPGTSPVGLFIGSGVLDPPLPTMWGNFYLQSPWVLFVLWQISTNGLIILTATLPSSIPAPYDLPMQALIGNELTNLCILEVR